MISQSIMSHKKTCECQVYYHYFLTDSHPTYIVSIITQSEVIGVGEKALLLTLDIAPDSKQSAGLVDLILEAIGDSSVPYTQPFL